MGNRTLRNKIQSLEQRLSQLERRLFGNQENGDNGPPKKKLAVGQGNRADAEQQGSQSGALQEAMTELRDELRAIRGAMNVVFPVLDRADSQVANIQREVNRMTAAQGNVTPAPRTAPSSAFGSHASLEQQRRSPFTFGQASTPPTTYLPEPTSSGFEESIMHTRLGPIHVTDYLRPNYATKAIGQSPCSTAFTTTGSTATALGQPSSFWGSSSPSRSDPQPRRVALTSAPRFPFQNQNPSPLSLFSYPGITSPAAATATVVSAPSTNQVSQVAIGRPAIGSPPGFSERAIAVPSTPPSQHAVIPSSTFGFRNQSPSASEIAQTLQNIRNENTQMLGSTSTSSTSRIASTNQATTPPPSGNANGDR